MQLEFTEATTETKRRWSFPAEKRLVLFCSKYMLNWYHRFEKSIASAACWNIGLPRATGVSALVYGVYEQQQCVKTRC